MKNSFEAKFTGWTFIISGLMLFFGWLLSSHHIGEYIVASDFAAVGEDLWYWIWMFRIHIFGWVIMGLAILALASLLNEKPYSIMIIPGAGVLVVGTFTLALAFAFYYSYGAWGIGQTEGRSPEEVDEFMKGVTIVNHYMTCLIRFGRVFSGVGLVILGIGLFKWRIMDRWISIFTVVMGLAAIGVVMLIPDNFEIYKPLFHIKVVWIILMGVIILTKGVNLTPQENK